MSWAGFSRAAGAALGARRARLWSLITTFPLNLANWTANNTPTSVSGVSDPFGGTDAVTTGDDDGSLFESHQFQTATSLTIGEQYRFIHWIKKDADTTRFPEIQHIAGTGFAHVQLNTQTGATVIRASANWTSLSVSAVTATEDAGWWKMTLRFTPAATNAPRVVYLPAAASTLGGSTVASETGTLTWYPGVRLETRS